MCQSKLNFATTISHLRRWLSDFRYLCRILWNL